MVAFDSIAQFLESSSAALGFQGLVDYVMHDRRFTRPRYSGDRDEQPQRNHQINILQIMRSRAKNPQKAPRRLMAHRWNRNAQLAVQISRGQRFAAAQKFAAWSRIEQFSSIFACAGAQIDDVIGGVNGVWI